MTMARHQTTQLSLCLLLALGLSACEPMYYGDLAEYNDLWLGSLELQDGATTTIALTLLVTEYDRNMAANDRFLAQSLYGRLDFEDEGYSFALAGEASHYDYTTSAGDYWEVHSPVEGREFLSLGLYDLAELGEAVELGGVVRDLGLLTEDIDQEFTLNVERTGPGQLEGFLDGRRFGSSEVPLRLGAVSLERERALEDFRVDSMTVESGPFVFGTRYDGANGTVFYTTERE